MNISGNGDATNTHLRDASHLGSFSGELSIIIHDLQVVELLSAFQDVCLQAVQLALESQALILERQNTGNEEKEKETEGVRKEANA